jgi:hypothetical protein
MPKLIFDGLNSLCACLEVSIVNFTERFLAKILKKIFFNDDSDAEASLKISSTVCGLLFNPFYDPSSYVCLGAWYTNEGIDWIAKNLIDISDSIDEAGEGIEKILSYLDIPATITLNVLHELLGLSEGGEIETVNTPCISGRAAEIGRQAFAYDLVSLCEVWKKESRVAQLLACKN